MCIDIYIYKCIYIYIHIEDAYIHIMCSHIYVYLTQAICGYICIHALYMYAHVKIHTFTTPVKD